MHLYFKLDRLLPGLLLGLCLNIGPTLATVVTVPAGGTTTTVSSTTTTTQATASANPALSQGWNLLGNSLDQPIAVASLLGDTTAVNTVWKWDSATTKWFFYTPSLDAAALQTYAAGKGYGVLSTINPGEGYWVNAKLAKALGTRTGALFKVSLAQLARGWNLTATGDNVTPTVFGASLGSSLTTLWAWDNASSKWYFYAPSLETQGGSALADYAAGKGYLHFAATGKTLGNETGFWVNMP